MSSVIFLVPDYLVNLMMTYLGSLSQYWLEPKNKLMEYQNQKPLQRVVAVDKMIEISTKHLIVT